MDEFYGKKLVISGPVKYVGEGEDPANDPFILAYANALKEVYQPERSKREDTCKHEWGSEEFSDSSKSFYKCNKCDAVL